MIAIVFVSGHPLAEDTGSGNPWPKSIDRPSIANFILQKEGEPAGGLLPQWSSGTAFLFPTAREPDRRKRTMVANPWLAKDFLGYDAGDGLEQAIAERIAVNARETGIPVATLPVRPLVRGFSKVDARLVRLRLPSPKPREALAGFSLDAIFRRLASI